MGGRRPRLPQPYFLILIAEMKHGRSQETPENWFRLGVPHQYRLSMASYLQVLAGFPHIELLSVFMQSLKSLSSRRIGTHLTLVNDPEDWRYSSARDWLCGARGIVEIVKDFKWQGAD